MMGLVSLPRWAARLLSATVIAAFAVGGAGAAGGASAASVAAPARVSASAGVASAGVRSAPAAPQTTPTFLWHTLPLVNGWQSASKPTLVTGTPAWALSKGVLYLRGAIMQPVTGGGTTFAQLPQAAWPASNLYFDVWTNGDVSGIVYVSKTGQMEAYAGNSTVMTSLAAVSYPATTMKSHKLALENGWVTSQSVWGTGDPSYEVSAGVVYLSGSMQAGTQHLAAVLPVAARPKHLLYVQVYNYGGTPGWLEIFPNGNLEAFGPAATSYTSLAVSFPTATAAWKAFTLEGGWTSAAGKFHTYGPAWTVINGIVYFTGSIYQASNTIGLWTTLPAGVKTKADVLEIETDTSGGNPGIVSVTDSLGLVGSVPYSNAQTFTSLAGIAYPQSS